jgi:hypothetical protein
MGETQLNKLQVAQNQAMRIILQCNRYTKVEHMLQALQFMSVRQRLCYNVGVLIFKILNNLAPMMLSNRLEMVGRGCDRQTRQAGNIVIIFRRTRSAQKSLFYEGIKMFNSFPTEIKHCDRIESFKRLLKVYIVNNV